MQLRNIKCIAGKVYELYINGLIGSEDCPASRIVDEIKYVKSNINPSLLKVRLNSPGGSVMDGVAIFSEILRSNIPFESHNDGMAGSMAGFFWLATLKENRYAADFALAMFHNPLFNGTSLEDLKDPLQKKAAEAFKSQIMTLINKYSRKSEKEMDAIMAATTWMTADDCVKEGFLLKENIEEYEQAPVLDAEKEQPEALYKVAATYMESVRAINEIYPNQVTIKNQINMNEQLRLKVTAALQLNEAANDEAILKAITAVQAAYSEEIKTVKAQITVLEGEKKTAVSKLATVEASLADYKVKEAKEAELKITAAVDLAIKDGKVEATAKDAMLILAKTDFSAFETMIKGLKVVVKAPDVMAHLSDDMKVVASSMGIEEKNLSFEFLSKNDPKLLKKLQSEQPAVYAALEAKYISGGSAYGTIKENEKA